MVRRGVSGVDLRTHWSPTGGEPGPVCGAEPEAGPVSLRVTPVLPLATCAACLATPQALEAPAAGTVAA